MDNTKQVKVKMEQAKTALLFSRLTWPSVMVQERACVAIADLLNDPILGESTKNYLLKWMSEQKLESVVTLGLLIFIRAKNINKSYEAPSEEAIQSAIEFPSLLSHLLFKQVFSKTTPPSVSALHSGPPPRDFSSKASFKNYWENFLPPIYKDLAEHIDDISEPDFTKQWECEWQAILARLGKLPPAEYPRHFWTSKKENWTLVDYEMGEVYRSAYLRALLWVTESNGLHFEALSFYAQVACPINLDLWQTEPQSKPTWWFAVEETKSSIDTVPSQVWRQVEALWSTQRNSKDTWVIAETTGHLYTGDLLYDLEIFGWFQRSFGTARPTQDELARVHEWFRWKNHSRIEPENLGFNGYIEPIHLSDAVQRVGDWKLIPACRRVTKVIVNNRWHFWRENRGVWAPAPFLVESKQKIECTNSSVAVLSENELLGKWLDWNDAVTESSHYDLPYANGQVLFVQRNLIESFAREAGFVFCWIACLTHRYKDQSWQDDYKKISYYMTFGTTSLFLPY